MWRSLNWIVVSNLHELATGKGRLVSDDAGHGVGQGFGHVHGRASTLFDRVDEFVNDEGMRVAVSACHSKRFGKHIG